MKIIEAMKKVKHNKEKIADLHNKIAQHCANLSFETPLYGSETGTKIKEWLQSSQDTSKENVRLLTAIARTNLQTNATIELGGKHVTKSVAEWVWRRREYAGFDAIAFTKLTDRNLKEGALPSSTGGTAAEVKIIRHFDPVYRDEMLSVLRSEPHVIDAALEVVNAVTDLVEA